MGPEILFIIFSFFLFSVQFYFLLFSSSIYEALIYLGSSPLPPMILVSSSSLSTGNGGDDRGFEAMDRAPSARGSPNCGHLAHYPDGYCAGSWGNGSCGYFQLLPIQPAIHRPYR